MMIVQNKEKWERDMIEYSDYVRYNEGTEANAASEKGETIYARLQKLEKLVLRQTKEIATLRTMVNTEGD
jgi:hypothetical protein